MRGRPHSREFKLSIVRELASGEKRPAQVCREHNLAASMIARWRQEYDLRGEAAFAPVEPTATEALEAKVAELERFCGQLALENTVLKKRSCRKATPMMMKIGYTVSRGKRREAAQGSGAPSPIKKLAEGRPEPMIVAAS